MPLRLTITDVRDLPHKQLLERLEEVLAEYDPPQVETQDQKLARLSLTIDQMPEVYHWLLGLWSWLDHWTDAAMKQFGNKDDGYKRLRQRRDLLEKQASAAKLRYEAASRLITVMAEFDPTGMPRTRRGPE